MISTSNTIDIKHILPIGSSSDYSTNNVHLEVNNQGNIAIVQSPSVTNSTTTETGLISFDDITLGTGLNRISMWFADNDDLDVSNTKLVKLGSTSIRYVSNTLTETYI